MAYEHHPRVKKRQSSFTGPKAEPSSGMGDFAGGGVEREDSELLLTQAAVDAMPPRKSLVRRPSVVQFAEMQEAAASLAREAAQQPQAEPPAKPKTKFQVTQFGLSAEPQLQHSRAAIAAWLDNVFVCHTCRAMDKVMACSIRTGRQGFNGC